MGQCQLSLIPNTYDLMKVKLGSFGLQFQNVPLTQKQNGVSTKEHNNPSEKIMVALSRSE